MQPRHAKVTAAAMLALALAVSLGATPLDLEAWNRERLTTSRVGLVTLGAWAVGNMAVGAIGFGLERDERLRFLHLGNLTWNVVNLALAVIGLVREWKLDPKAFDAKQSLLESESSEKVFFINGALDLGYLALAAFLWQRGEATADPRLVGFGQALLIQGGFLLLFDVTMGVLNARLTGKLVEGVTVSVTPTSVSGTF